MFTLSSLKQGKTNILSTCGMYIRDKIIIKQWIMRLKCNRGINSGGQVKWMQGRVTLADSRFHSLFFATNFVSSLLVYGEVASSSAGSRSLHIYS